jgi:hypothetical protein
VLCLLPIGARADAQATDGEQPCPAADTAPPRALAQVTDRDERLAWLGGVGMRLGTLKIDGTDSPRAFELVGAGGVRYGRFSVLGEYGVSLVHHDADASGEVTAQSAGSEPAYLEKTTDGVMHRLGVDARYAFLHGGGHRTYADDGDLASELWVQAGFDEQIIQWDLGGRLVRPELSLAVGGDWAYRTANGRRRGMYADLRLQVSRRIDRDDAGATCAAPCTEATPPVAWSDRAVLVEVGVLFGR